MKAPDLKKQVAEATRWIEEPLYWARKFGGEAFDPWSEQEKLWIEYGKILGAKMKRYKGIPMTEEEKRYARKMGISIQAGKGVGKGANISLLAYHYQMVLYHIKPKVVCTAPAGPQLHSSLWPEFGVWLQKAPFLNEMFEKLSDRIYMKIDSRRGEFTRIEPRTVQQNSSPDAQKEVLQGIHATGVLIVIDEASGVPNNVFEPLEGGLTDPLSMIVMIYNPTRRSGFAIESQTKNRQDWVCLHWSGRKLKQEKLANPGRFKWFNEEAQDTLIRKYGDDSDYVRVNVDGLPPTEASNTLIPWSAVMDATERQVEIFPGDPLVLGVDVGGEGDDPTIVMPFRGPKVIGIDTYKSGLTDQVADFVAGKYKSYLLQTEENVQSAIGVDSIGIGRGVYSNLLNIHMIRQCYSVDVSEKAFQQDKFHRLRDEVWWMARESFCEKRDAVIPNDDELIAELTTPTWGEPNGKIKVEGKLELRKRNIDSPNKADAYCIGNYVRNRFVSHIPERARRRRRSMVGAGVVRNWRTV